MRIKCPHCNHESTIRTSKIVTEITREARVQCNNLECAHTWVAVISAIRTIAPSMTPNPKVYIPISPNSPAAKAPTGNQMDLGMECPPPRMAPTG